MKFRAHETFAIRKGWLTKGMRQVQRNARLFLEKDNAMDVLGIGSNMVKSLRYWLPAVGLTVENRQTGQQLTRFGQLVMEHDPYLEEIGTLWMLHYFLVRNQEIATSWYFFFQQFNLSEFKRSDFRRQIENYANLAGEYPPQRSLDDDFNCIVNTYMPRYKTAPKKDDPESNMECPLSELGLLDFQNPKERSYRKLSPSSETIPSEIAVAVLIDYAQGRKELTLSELQRSDNSIGKIFNLDAVSLLSVLSKAESAGYITVTRTAGLDVVKLNYDSSMLDMVERYYQTLV